jgi:hypothetical protein
MTAQKVITFKTDQPEKSYILIVPFMSLVIFVFFSVDFD